MRRNHRSSLEMIPSVVDSAQLDAQFIPFSWMRTRRAISGDVYLGEITTYVRRRRSGLREWNEPSNTFAVTSAIARSPVTVPASRVRRPTRHGMCPYPVPTAHCMLIWRIVESASSLLDILKIIRNDLKSVRVAANNNALYLETTIHHDKNDQILHTIPSDAGARILPLFIMPIIPEMPTPTPLCYAMDSASDSPTRFLVSALFANLILGPRRPVPLFPFLLLPLVTYCFSPKVRDLPPMYSLVLFGFPFRGVDLYDC
jgi:hypothetical protein